MKDDLNNKTEGINGYARFSGYVIQMGATIFLGTYLGKFLDEKYPAEKKWFTMILCVLSVVLSLFILLKQINKFNEEQDQLKKKEKESKDV